MKLYRYMSINEFTKMSTGKTMEPYHKEFVGYETESKGFCFISESTPVDYNNNTYELTPIESLNFLKNIVCEEILVEFETTDDIEYNEGKAQYANPISEYNQEDMEIIEFSCDKYNKYTLIPKRYILNPSEYIYNIENMGIGTQYIEENRKYVDNAWDSFEIDRKYSCNDLKEKIVRRKNQFLGGGTNIEDSENIKFLSLISNKEEECRIDTNTSENKVILFCENPITEEKVHQMSFVRK